MPPRRPFSQRPIPPDPARQAIWFPKWMLGIGAMVAMACLAALVHSTLGRPSRVMPLTESQNQSPPAPVVDPDAARRVLERFLSASNPDEIAGVIFDGPGTAAAMRDYYRNRPQALPHGGKLVAGARHQSMSLSQDVLWWKVKMPDGVVRPAATIVGPDGPRLLWEAFVAHGDMAWDDFLEKGATRPVMLRVLVRRAPGLTSETSGGELRHVEVAHPDSLGTIVARVEREVDQANLIGAFDMGAIGQRVTARFLYPGGNTGTESPALVEILSDDWGESGRITSLPPEH